MTECEIQVDEDGQITIPVGHILDCLYERDEESVLEWIGDLINARTIMNQRQAMCLRMFREEIKAVIEFRLREAEILCGNDKAIEDQIKNLMVDELTIHAAKMDDDIRNEKGGIIYQRFCAGVESYSI